MTIHRQNFEIDTYEKAMNFVWAMRLNRAVERLQFILDCYPELGGCTHQYLGELLGLERESITRALKTIRLHEQAQQLKKESFMKKWITVLTMLFVLMMGVGAAEAQFKFSTQEAPKFNLTIVPYTDVKLYTDSNDADPILRYGVRFEVNNFLFGLSTFVAFEGGKIDTRTDDVKGVCTDPRGCVWPQDFINSVENSQDYVTIRWGMQTPVRVFE